MVLNKVSEVIENAGLNAVEHVALRGRHTRAPDRGAPPTRTMSPDARRRDVGLVARGADRVRPSLSRPARSRAFAIGGKDLIDGLSGLSRTGGFRDKDHLNRRVIGPVQLAAGELLGARKLAPLPTRLSAHVFRRTYITLVAEAGDLSFTFKSGEDPIGLE